MMLLCLFTAFAVVHAEGEKKAVLKLEKTKHDFGKIKAGNLYTVEIKVTNTGNKPLLLTKVDVSCNCITVDYPKAPILPGKTITLKVTLDAKESVGHIMKSIYINSNAENKLEVIHIQAQIE